MYTFIFYYRFSRRHHIIFSIKAYIAVHTDRDLYSQGQCQSDRFYLKHIVSQVSDVMNK